MKTLLQIAGLFVCALVVFFGTFKVTFPSRAVADRVSYEAQERMNLAVEVQRPRPKGLTGVRFKSLALGKLPEGDEEPRPLLTMGRTWIKIKPIAALRGVYDVKFDGSLYDGKAHGNVQYSEESIGADVEIEKLQVSAFPLQGQTWNIAGGGAFNADIDLQLDQTDITQSTGELSFDFDGLSFREGSQIYGLDVETVFEEAGGYITVENGRATFERTRFKGDKLEGEITGHIALKEDLMKSRLALKCKFRLVDDTLDSLLALQMGANPAHKDAKGYYHYIISGPLESPRPREDRASARRSKRGRGRDTVDRDENDEGTAPTTRGDARSKRLDEMSDDERAEWDAQREKRREELREKREQRRAAMEEKRAAAAGDRDGMEDVGTTARTGDDARVPVEDDRIIDPPSEEDYVDLPEIDENEFIEEEGGDEGEYVEEGAEVPEGGAVGY